MLSKLVWFTYSYYSLRIVTDVCAKSADHENVMLERLLPAILAMTAVIYVDFRYSTGILSCLGTTGMDVLNKVFGLIALGVQFVLTGLADAFPTWV
jgi:small neutral amino acid transporter SnatA (MarC family)